MLIDNIMMNKDGNWSGNRECQTTFAFWAGMGQDGGVGNGEGGAEEGGDRGPQPTICKEVGVD